MKVFGLTIPLRSDPLWRGGTVIVNTRTPDDAIEQRLTYQDGMVQRCELWWLETNILIMTIDFPDGDL